MMAAAEGGSCSSSFFECWFESLGFSGGNDGMFTPSEVCFVDDRSPSEVAGS